MANEIRPDQILVDAIRWIRSSHFNNYSWSLTISDEEAIDILSNAICKL